jgi:uncharacterized membrane protein
MTSVPVYLMLSESIKQLGLYHPIFIHFPIVLFTVALICHLIAGIGKKGALFVGHWMIIAGTIMCLPALLSGLEASARFDPNDHYLETHKWLAFGTTAAGFIYSFLCIGALREKFHLPAIIYIALSVGLVSLISWTSDYGGLMTRTATPFSSRQVAEIQRIADPQDVSQFSAKQLEAYLQKTVSVHDVMPIFKTHKCAMCHSENFIDGFPIHFSEGENPESVFLPRNPDGSLKDIQNSAFYQTVILKNAMPLDNKNESLGLSVGERLLLLQWLENGAMTH